VKEYEKNSKLLAGLYEDTTKFGRNKESIPNW